MAGGTKQPRTSSHHRSPDHQYYAHVKKRHDGRPEPSRWYGFCNTAWGETLAGKLKSSSESTS
jgi:hypothetical protein